MPVFQFAFNGKVIKHKKIYILYTDFVKAENRCIFVQLTSMKQIFLGKNRRCTSGNLVVAWTAFILWEFERNCFVRCIVCVDRVVLCILCV